MTVNLQNDILTRISQIPFSVFIRADISDLASYSQVGKILNRLVKQGIIVRISYGVYAKTKISTLSNQRIPVRSLPELARETLNRLGINTVPSTFEQAYNKGLSTQVPTGRTIGVISNTNIKRKIGYNGAYITFERYTRKRDI